MNFSTKTEYFVAVAQWKLQYLELSKKIRELKRRFKAAQRGFSKLTGDWSKEHSDLNRDIVGLRDLIAYSKDDANELLAERAAGRVEANRQWMAAQP